jgi:two-component system, chemotaxis family, protein-glutamate methylesterase/glutaminase
MEQKHIRILIVDDSAVMRAMLSDKIASAPGLSVAGIARDGQAAIAAVLKLQPDIVTLDLQMPGMDGLETLDAILDSEPRRVIMVSALTRAGAAVTLDALERGASDYVAKPERGVADMSAFVTELIHKIRNVSDMNVQRVVARRRKQSAVRRATGVDHPITKPTAEICPAELAKRCVAIGISTGGPPALTTLLESLRPPMPPIVIVQHMPAQFTGPLAARLNTISSLTVREAAQGDQLQPNTVFIAPGGIHMELRGRGEHVCISLRDAPPVSSHKPSVDVMMTSAAKVFGHNCLGVVMTGMGRDGSDGCRAIRAAGGYVLGQDDASSDVYGMNRVAFVEGNVDQQFALQDGAHLIYRQVRRLGCSTVAS